MKQHLFLTKVFRFTLISALFEKSKQFLTFAVIETSKKNIKPDKFAFIRFQKNQKDSRPLRRTLIFFSSMLTRQNP